MREYSDDTNENYDWYKIENTVLGVREKKSGGFSIKSYHIDSVKAFKTLLLKIIEYYKYQFITFDTRSIKDNVKIMVEKELRNMGFGSYQSHNMVFQEKPKHKRPWVHAKTKASKSKSSKNYSKRYVGQG